MVLTSFKNNFLSICILRSTVMIRKYHRKSYRLSRSTEVLSIALIAVRALKHGKKTLGEASVEFGISKAALRQHTHGSGDFSSCGITAASDVKKACD